MQAKSHSLGFMGDGINDAAAMCDADVGISVDTAINFASALKLQALPLSYFPWLLGILLCYYSPMVWLKKE